MSLLWFYCPTCVREEGGGGEEAQGEIKRENTIKHRVSVMKAGMMH